MFQIISKQKNKSQLKIASTKKKKKERKERARTHNTTYFPNSRKLSMWKKKDGSRKWSFTIYKHCSRFKRSQVFQRPQLLLGVEPADSGSRRWNKCKRELKYHPYKYKVLVPKTEPAFKEPAVRELFNSFPTTLSMQMTFKSSGRP